MSIQINWIGYYLPRHEVGVAGNVLLSGTVHMQCTAQYLSVYTAWQVRHASDYLVTITIIIIIIIIINFFFILYFYLFFYLLIYLFICCLLIFIQSFITSAREVMFCLFVCGCLSVY